MDFDNQDNIINNYNNYLFRTTQDTFKAYVDEIIPRTPDLAEEYGIIQYFGALDLHTYEYLILISLYEQYGDYFSRLQEPFQYDLGLVFTINSTLNRYTMMGYYSEWFGYGSTRLETPNQRILEFYPLSWKQIGYPGPSLGYRALRK